MKENMKKDKKNLEKHNKNMGFYTIITRFSLHFSKKTFIIKISKKILE
jgi:hypothetical protein